MAPYTQKILQNYIQHTRSHMRIAPKSTDIAFLNTRGTALSRVMVFIMIKEMAAKAGSTEVFLRIHSDILSQHIYYKMVPILDLYKNY